MDKQEEKNKITCNPVTQTDNYCSSVDIGPLSLFPKFLLLVKKWGQAWGMSQLLSCPLQESTVIKSQCSRIHGKPDLDLGGCSHLSALFWWEEISSIISSDDAFVRQMSNQGSYSWLKQDPLSGLTFGKGGRDWERKFTTISNWPGFQFQWIVGMQSRNQARGQDTWGRDNVKTITVLACGSLWDHARALQPGLEVTRPILAQLLLGMSC